MKKYMKPKLIKTQFISSDSIADYGPSAYVAGMWITFENSELNNPDCTCRDIVCPCGSSFKDSSKDC